MKIILTQGEKKFILGYLIFHLIALFSNVLYLNWGTKTNETNFPQAYSNQDEYKEYFYLTDCAERADFQENREHFWPFVNYSENAVYTSHWGTYPFRYEPYFKGIFTGYDYSEFGVYLILLIIIMAVRKFWLVEGEDRKYGDKKSAN